MLGEVAQFLGVMNLVALRRTGSGGSKGPAVARVAREQALSPVVLGLVRGLREQLQRLGDDVGRLEVHEQRHQLVVEQVDRCGEYSVEFLFNCGGIGGSRFAHADEGKLINS